MALTIGKVEELDLELTAGVDVSFDIEFTDEETDTPIALSAAAAKIKRAAGGELLFDLAPTITGPASNIVHVAQTAAATASLVPTDRAVWDVRVTLDPSGEERVLCRGSVRIVRLVSA